MCRKVWKKWLQLIMCTLKNMNKITKKLTLYKTIKFLELSKLKEFADVKINVSEKNRWGGGMYGIENIVGKKKMF